MVQPMIFVNGGAERQLAELANYLTDRNYRVTLFTAKAIPEFKKTLKETRILECGDPQRVWNAVTHFQHKFEIYNAHNDPSQMFTWRLGLPCVWQCNEPPDMVLRGQPLDPNQKVVTQETVKKYVVISDYNKEWIKKIYGNDIDVTVNHPGIRYDFFAQDIPQDSLTLRKKWGYTKKDFIVLQTGYIVWTKNQLKTLETFDEILKVKPTAKMIFAGWDKDEYTNKLKADIEKRGLEKSVKIMPYVEKDTDIRELYKMSDLFVNPVLQQGGYATTFEAIASGIPTIVSDTFVSSNLIREHELALAPSLDKFVETAVDVVNNNYLDGLKTQTLGKRIWIKDNLNWNIFGQVYEKVFHEAYEYG